MPENRARDVMLAANELAANAIRHGAGTGRLQMQAGDGMLRMQVHDVGPASLNGLAGTAGLDGQDTPGGGADGGWPFQPGHGLWLVRQVADQMRVWRGAGRDGGDGGLCAARCGSTARTGRRGWLLTVWPGLGQHGPGARRSPRRVPPWAVAPAGRGHDVSRPEAAGPLILIPPEDRGPALGPFPGRPHGPARESAKFPAAACMAAGRAGRSATGRRIPGRPKRRVVRPTGPGRPARAAPGRRRPGDAGGSWPAAFPGLPRGWTCAGRGRRVGLSAGVWFLPGLALPPGSGRDPAFPRDSRDGRLSVGSCDD